MSGNAANVKRHWLPPLPQVSNYTREADASRHIGLKIVEW